MAALNHHVGSDGEPVPHSYFVRTGQSSYRSTLHAQGAWQAGEQHMGAASGLVIHHLETALPGDKLISRITFDILGVIHSGEFDVEVEVVRPGRTIELVEARMVHRAEHTGAEAVPAAEGKPARPAVEGRARTSVVARVWRLVSSDTAPVAGEDFDAMTALSECEPLDTTSLWPGGYIASLRSAEAVGARPGRRQAWLWTEVPLVDGEPDAPYAHVTKFVDSMNGFAVREDPQTIFFPNVDLSIHFLRAPELSGAAGGSDAVAASDAAGSDSAGASGAGASGTADTAADAVGVDIRQSFGGSGLGVTEARLHDLHGPFAIAAQALTVRMPVGGGRADG